MNEEFLTVVEAAAALKIHPQTVRDWLRTGQLRGLRTSQNGRWRVPRSAIAEALTAPRSEATGASAP